MGVSESVRAGILIASVSRTAGGLYDAVRYLCRALHVPPRLEIRVFGLEDKYTRDDLPGWETVPVHICRARGPRALGYSPTMSAALRAADLDLLHAHGLWMYPSVASLRWARTEHKPYIITPHGMLDPWAIQNSRLKKRVASVLYENAHLRSAACLHALCEAEAESIRAYGLRNPICVIPHGIALPVEKGEPPPWVRSLPPGSKILLYLGRLHPKKGLSNLLRAWHAVRQRRPYADRWHLVIAGWEQAGHEKYLRALIQQLCIRNSVHLVGHQFGADKAGSYYHADAFVLPSFSEGLPMSVLEAWSYRLPVLMTTQCNIPEGFKAGAALELHPQPDSIAHALDTLLAMSPRERQAMGSRGHQLLEKRFSLSKNAGEMLAVYNWTLGGGSPPGCVIT